MGCFPFAAKLFYFLPHVIQIQMHQQHGEMYPVVHPFFADLPEAKHSFVKNLVARNDLDDGIGAFMDDAIQIGDMDKARQQLLGTNVFVDSELAEFADTLALGAMSAVKAGGFRIPALEPRTLLAAVDPEPLVTADPKVLGSLTGSQTRFCDARQDRVEGLAGTWGVGAGGGVVSGTGVRVGVMQEPVTLMSTVRACWLSSR